MPQLGPIQALSCDALFKMIVQLSTHHFDYLVLNSQANEKTGSMLSPFFIKKLAECNEDADFTKVAAIINGNLEPHKIFGQLPNLAKFTEIVQKMAFHWTQVYRSETSATRLTQMMEFSKSLIKNGLFKSQVHI